MSTDPLRPHSHDNNTQPPSADTYIVLKTPLAYQTVTIGDLLNLPQTNFDYTYTTDHGKHGPYSLKGVKLIDVLTIVGKCDKCDVSHVEVISADGFGNRVDWPEVVGETAKTPIILCLESNNQPLTLANGLVRLVVPSEIDNALRQIKWVRHINAIPNLT